MNGVTLKTLAPPRGHSAGEERLPFHRSPLRTEAVLNVPAMSGVLLFTCGKGERANSEQFREEARRGCIERPPWVRVWPGAGVVAIGLPPVPTAVVRVQFADVWIDPDGHSGQGYDLGWRTELGFEVGLGDRHLPWRHPTDVAGIPAEPQTCVCRGDGDGAARITFPLCHHVWFVADWAGGRDVSVIGCKYLPDLAARKRSGPLPAPPLAQRSFQLGQFGVPTGIKRLFAREPKTQHALA